MDTRFTVLPASLTLAELAGQGSLKDPSVMHFLVEDGGGIIGLVTREAALSNLKRGRKTDTIGDVARKDYLVATEKTSIPRLFSGIFSHEISFILVLSDGTAPSTKNVRGLITKERLAEFVTEADEQFSP
jgi:predicted transcriptional regulator